MLRSFLDGFILSMQFFSSIPLSKKEVPITDENIKRAVQLFPILGLVQGLILFVLLYVLHEWSFFTPLAIAFFLWLMTIVMTGGIHLDGWIDSSDAFFSYRDRKRRIEILSDPRVGAFGLISAIVLLAARFLFIYETIQMIHTNTFLFIVLIPILGKIFMGWLLTTVQPVKETGIGYLFHKASNGNIFIFYCFYTILIFIFIAIFQLTLLYMLCIVFAVTIFAYFFAKRKAKVWFGGITGDVVGGATEGVETLLWMIVWLYHYYVMGLL